MQAPLHVYLTNTRKNDRRKIAWTVEAENAFNKAKQELIDATLLTHPSKTAETRVITDASALAIGAALEQRESDTWKPLAFFSRKLSAAQQKYSTYDRELLAIYETIKYFRYYLEGRAFKIYIDHKPLMYAFKQRSDKASPRQLRQLTFIAQFSTDIEYLPGVDNVVGYRG